MSELSKNQNKSYLRWGKQYSLHSFVTPKITFEKPDKQKN